MTGTVWVYGTATGRSAQKGFRRNVHKALRGLCTASVALVPCTLQGAISLALPPALSPSSPSFMYFELRDVKLNADGHIHTDVEGQS